MVSLNGTRVSIALDKMRNTLRTTGCLHVSLHLRKVINRQYGRLQRCHELNCITKTWARCTRDRSRLIRLYQVKKFIGTQSCSLTTQSRLHYSNFVYNSRTLLSHLVQSIIFFSLGTNRTAFLISSCLTLKGFRVRDSILRAGNTGLRYRYTSTLRRHCNVLQCTIGALQNTAVSCYGYLYMIRTGLQLSSTLYGKTLCKVTLLIMNGRN